MCDLVRVLAESAPASVISVVAEAAAASGAEVYVLMRRGHLWVVAAASRSVRWHRDGMSLECVIIEEVSGRTEESVLVVVRIGCNNEGPSCCTAVYCGGDVDVGHGVDIVCIV